MIDDHSNWQNERQILSLWMTLVPAKTQTDLDTPFGLSLLCLLQGPSGWTISTAQAERRPWRPVPPTAGASPTASTQKTWAWCVVTKGFLVSSSTIR